jgi:hypothetical protein
MLPPLPQSDRTRSAWSRQRKVAGNGREGAEAREAAAGLTHVLDIFSDLADRNACVCQRVGNDR